MNVACYRQYGRVGSAGARTEKRDSDGIYEDHQCTISPRHPSVVRRDARDRVVRFEQRLSFIELIVARVILENAARGTRKHEVGDEEEKVRAFVSKVANLVVIAHDPGASETVED